MTRVLLLLVGALLVAAPAIAHQETRAYSRLVVRDNGDVEYTLKIPVEDLAETLGKSGHAPLNAPEVRGAEELLFDHFQPLVGVSSGGTPCAVERSGIEVPEDERLYGEMRLVFHCPAGALVTLDYRVFFDIDPGHMGMLEIESAGGKARAELIAERPRWEIDPTLEGPPKVRHLEGAAVAAPRPRRVGATRPVVAPQPVERAEPAARNLDEASPMGKPAKVARSGWRNEWLIVLVVLALAGTLPIVRAAWRRLEPRSR